MPTATRQVAGRIIARWLQTGDFPERLLPDAVPARALLMELVYGVARWKRLLEWVADARIRRRPAPELWALALVGLYQLLVLTEIAPYAAVNETVAAAKAAHGRRAAAFINALLRGVLREREDLRRSLAAQPLGVRTSHPDILVARWTHVFGAADAARLCAWNNTRPEVWLRVNTLKISHAAFRERLRRAGLELADRRLGPDGCLPLPRGRRVAALPGYGAGHFLVLDPASLGAAAQLDPQPGENVLDACAAPGGKTFLLAQAMRGRGRLLAMDLHADRLALLCANLRRLGCAGFVEVRRGDAGAPAAIPGGPFDRILLDAPCTNTGVLRRRPDARWRFSETRLAQMTRLQQRLLASLAGQLKPGGRLVYSTCSLEPEEDEAQVAAFLKSQPGFRRRSEHKLFPPRSRTDGAYAAVLEKS